MNDTHNQPLIPAPVQPTTTHLGLDILPAPLLGDFLGETLLVHTPVDNGPRDLSGVLSLQEEGFRLGADESEDLGKPSNIRMCPDVVSRRWDEPWSHPERRAFPWKGRSSDPRSCTIRPSSGDGCMARSAACSVILHFVACSSPPGRSCQAGFQRRGYFLFAMLGPASLGVRLAFDSWLCRSPDAPLKPSTLSHPAISASLMFVRP